MLVNRDRFEPFVPHEKLLSFESAGVGKITIVDNEGTLLTLKKEGGSWAIPALEEFPAAGETVEALIEKITGLDAAA